MEKLSIQNILSFASKAMSLVMAVLVLNICIQLPISSINTFSQGDMGLIQESGKMNQKFPLEALFDYLTDSEGRMPDSGSASLLEELNEVKENWHVSSSENKLFPNAFLIKKHQTISEDVPVLSEDERLSPPPERV